MFFIIYFMNEEVKLLQVRQEKAERGNLPVSRLGSQCVMLLMQTKFKLACLKKSQFPSSQASKIWSFHKTHFLETAVK